MFVKDQSITFTGTISKSKYNSSYDSVYKWILTNPNNYMGEYSTLTFSTALSATVDGIFSVTLTPSNTGLYKISVYAENDADASYGSGILLGEYLFNVVDKDTTASFRI